MQGLSKEQKVFSTIFFWFKHYYFANSFSLFGFNFKVGNANFTVTSIEILSVIELCFRAGLHNDGFRSKKATADGQCLYHSVSLLCYGNEDHSLEIKVFAAIQMILNR